MWSGCKRKRLENGALSQALSNDLTNVSLWLEFYQTLAEDIFV